MTDSVHFNPPVAPFDYESLDRVGVEGEFTNVLPREPFQNLLSLFYPHIDSFKNVQVCCLFFLLFPLSLFLLSLLSLFFFFFFFLPSFSSSFDHRSLLPLLLSSSFLFRDGAMVPSNFLMTTSIFFSCLFACTLL